MNEYRTYPFSSQELYKTFHTLGGYIDIDNQGLAMTLRELNLLHSETNRKNKENLKIYQQWSFTASFLQMINAWQWFFSGVLLGRQAYLPSQTIQMYYYSIFFCYGAFLSAHFKGYYTVDYDESNKRQRREVWITKEKHNNNQYIEINKQSRGGEHKNRAEWFHQVFKKWELSNNYPDILDERNMPDVHSNFRNLTTYSLDNLAEELYYSEKERSAPISNEILIELWQKNPKYIEQFPEEFHSLEYLRVIVDLHTKVLKSKCNGHQRQLLDTMYTHLSETGLDEFFREVMPIT